MAEALETSADHAEAGNPAGKPAEKDRFYSSQR